MTNDQDAYRVIGYTEQKMKWKSLEIHAPEITLAKAVSFRRVGSFLEEGSQLSVELISKLLPPTSS